MLGLWESKCYLRKTVEHDVSVKSEDNSTTYPVSFSLSYWSGNNMKTWVRQGGLFKTVQDVKVPTCVHHVESEVKRAACTTMPQLKMSAARE